jgi:hypothetical protein
LRRRGAWAWFHDIWICSAKVLEYWMVSSLKIKLNHSWKFWRNWNVPLVLLERFWWAGFNGIYYWVRFGFRMWEILNFKWFLLLKIQINSQKNQVLEGKISWGRGNTRANGTGHNGSQWKEAIFLLIFGDHYLIYHVQWVSLSKIFIKKKLKKYVVTYSRK